MQQLVLRGTSAVWPNACACCLSPAGERVPVQSTQSTYMVVASYRRTLTLQVPYCADCASRIRHRQQMTPWVKALLVFVGIWMGGTVVAALLGGALRELAPLATALLLPLLSCGAPIVGTWLYVRRARRARPAALPAPHFCGTADGVSITGFGKESVTVSMVNDQFADALRSLNPAGAS